MHGGASVDAHDKRLETLDRGQFMLRGLPAIYNGFDLSQEWMNITTPTPNVAVIDHVEPASDGFIQIGQQRATERQKRSADDEQLIRVDEMTAAEMYIHSWANSRTDEEISAYGAQAALRHELDQAQLPCSKSHVSTVLKEYREQRKKTHES